jgi:hypothetical protein
MEPLSYSRIQAAAASGASAAATAPLFPPSPPPSPPPPSVCVLAAAGSSSSAAEARCPATARLAPISVRQPRRDRSPVSALFVASVWLDRCLYIATPRRDVGALLHSSDPSLVSRLPTARRTRAAFLVISNFVAQQSATGYCMYIHPKRPARRTGARGRARDVEPMRSRMSARLWALRNRHDASTASASSRCNRRIRNGVVKSLERGGGAAES